MRHQKKRHKLGRTASHRKATLAALASALIAHKRIETTLPKAKALRTFVEPLITRAKEDSTHNRREAFRHLRNKVAVTELFVEIAAQVGDRPGGYTRVVRLGQRQGDAAEMAVIELVDWNDVKPEGASGTKKKTRRGAGRGRRKKETETAAAPAASKATPASGPSKPATTGAEEDEAPEPEAKGASTGSHNAPKTAADPEVNRRPDAPQGANPGQGSPPPEAGKGTKGVAGGSKHRG